MPACYSLVRYIELDVMTANTANLDFHFYNTNNTAVNDDRRIQCTGGGSTVRTGTLSYYATQHTFHGALSLMVGATSVGVATSEQCHAHIHTQVNISGSLYTMALVSDIPVLTLYALLARHTFTGIVKTGTTTVASTDFVTGYISST